MISVVIPVWNEEERIEGCLASLACQQGSFEIIVCDGGSTDHTCDIVQTFTKARLVLSKRGRAFQMNKGAEAAAGQVFWFVHADSLVPQGAVSAIEQALHDAEVLGGAFQFSLDSSRFSCRMIERVVRLRTSVIGMPYGDQGYFLRAEVFRKIGGYPEVPILEDMYLWRSLRRLGKTRILDAYLRTSARRWERQGIIKTTLLNWAIVLLDCFGVSLQRLADFRSLDSRCVQDSADGSKCEKLQSV